MTFTSAFNNVVLTESGDTNLIEKVRRSINQRLGKQIDQLTAEFFARVDKFLIDNSRRARVGENCIYLNSMSEIHSKRRLFEERFHSSVIEAIESASNSNSDASELDEPNDDFQAIAEGGIEKLEIDLALQAMALKANRVFQPFSKKIDSLNAVIKQALTGADLENDVFESAVLISSTLLAFEEAQRVFSLTLTTLVLFGGIVF